MHSAHITIYILCIVMSSRASCNTGIVPESLSVPPSQPSYPRAPHNHQHPAPGLLANLGEVSEIDQLPETTCNSHKMVRKWQGCASISLSVAETGIGCDSLGNLPHSLPRTPTSLQNSPPSPLLKTSPRRTNLSSSIKWRCGKGHIMERSVSLREDMHKVRASRLHM